MWNKVDKEIGWIFINAEKSLTVPKIRTDWSPPLAHTGSTLCYWRTRLSLAKSGNPINPNLRCTKTMLKIQDDLTNNIRLLETSCVNALNKYQALRLKDKETQSEHLDNLYSQHSTPSTKKERKAVAAIHGAELKRKMFQNIKRTLCPVQSASVSRVDIPIDMVPYFENTDGEDQCIDTICNQFSNAPFSKSAHKALRSEWP